VFWWKFNAFAVVVVVVEEEEGRGGGRQFEVL
jgi:hypothetical protein